MGRRRRAPTAGLPVLPTLLLLACGEELAKPEIFRIVQEPVSFSPPSRAWRREPHSGIQNFNAISFRLPNAAIHFGEYDRPGLVRSRECLREFIPRYRELSYQRAQEEMQDCKPQRNPRGDHEAMLMERFQERFREAFAAHIHGDAAQVEASLTAALAVAEETSYDIEDVLVAPYKFSPARHEDPSVFRDLREERVEVGGQPAVRISYRVRGHSSGREYHGRWVYVLSPNDHLFAFHYYGHEAPLADFDRLLASVTFPSGP